jgi:Coenzyme PQQ synthesis protein D (PqqD)
MGGRFLRLADFVEVEAGSDSDGAVLINGRSGVIYSCNATAAILASEMVKGAELESLRETLMRHFDVSADRALRDTHQFIDALYAAGLLEMIECPITEGA